MVTPRTDRAVRTLVAAAVLSFAASSSRAGETPQPVDRVRLLPTCLPTLISDTAAVSPTVRALLARLDRSDLILFVRCAAFLGPSIAGRLLFLGATAAHRFVLIEIRIPAPWHTQAAVAAHELQHAVEIAEAPSIRSQADMARHYARTGIAVGGLPPAFETEAARQTGLRVSRELPAGGAAESARMRESRGDLPSQR